jgi:hypothetical protein
MLIIFFSLALAPISQFMDGLFYTGWGPDNTFGLYSIQYGYALILFFTASANIGLWFFAFYVFFSGGSTTLSGTSNILRMSAAILLASLGAIGGIWKIMSLDVTVIIALYFVIAMIMYILLAQMAYRLAKKVQDRIYNQSLRYIGHFAISLLTIYIFFILDSFSTTYTIWGFFGWTMFLVATCLGYVGFVKPMKLKKGSSN